MSEVVQKMLLDESGQPRDRIVGFETEYSLDALSPQGVRMSEETAYRIMEFSVRGKNEYFDDGARIYIDVGGHPEYSTAEDTIFLDAAYRLLAGHSKMATIFNTTKDKLVEAGTISNCVTEMVANTCDPQGNSWASHENFLASRGLQPRDYVAGLAAHNLSRIVWSGAGYVGKNPKKYHFSLSEKADFMWEVYGDMTTRLRALVNSRDEPLADPEKYRRIHNIAGESVFSPFANALRLASGSIVLRACEAGTSFEDLLPFNPIHAMRQISGDPTLKAKVILNNRQIMTGVDLQLSIAERAITTAPLTEQESHWADQWLEVLNDLKRDPQNCADRVDWVIKQKLIERELDTNPGNPKDVAWAKAVDYHRLLPREKEVDDKKVYIDGAGMKLLRRGFFRDSPTQDILEKGLPLPNTRARLRGEAIARAQKERVDYACDWMHFKVINAHQRMVVLRDPFASHDPRMDKIFERGLSSPTYQVY